MLVHGSDVLFHAHSCWHVLYTCGAAMYSLQAGMCDVAGRHTVSLGQVLHARLRELRQFVRAESATSMSRTYGGVGLY